MEVEPTILLPGSFNPIHKGHLSIAENVLRAMPEATLWFVVSPQNPLKSPSELAAERHRLQMARIAVGSSPLRERMAVCDVEFTLPKPSLTLRTLDTRRAGSPCWSTRTLSESSDAGTGPERFWTASRFWSIRAGRSRTAFPTNASRF